MGFPAALRAYLEKLFEEQNSPIVLELDDAFRARATWGDLAQLGLPDEPGEHDLRAPLPVLAGLDFSQDLTLPFVTLAPGQIFHIHVVRADESRFVLFVNAGREHAREQEMQQKANEIRLLSQRQQRLVEQLQRTTEKLSDEKRRAERANSVKARFIASMSHEFRTPLTSVLGYAELISAVTPVNDDRSAHAEAIGRSARHLLAMVDNILDQARLEEGNVVVHLAPARVRDFVDDVAAIMAPLAAAKLLNFGAFVAPEVPEWVNTDIVRLRQALLNVVGNAIKFTSEGEVRLELEWKGRQLHMLVSDTGPGIDETQAIRIFDAFHRTPESASIRGTGLGLNITRQLLRLLGGDISVQSEPGVGSRFLLEIPAVAAKPPKIPAHNACDMQVQGPVILVAEDDPDIADLLEIYLRDRNCQLVQVANGHDAVTAALANSPDLVLMDVNMPRQSGLDATRELRGRNFVAPILALTASLGADDRDQAYAAGCDGYLIKPISKAELLRAVARYLPVLA